MGIKDLLVELDDDSISDIVQVLIQDVIWAVNNNFGQTGNGGLMMYLVCRLFENREWHSEELQLKELHLLLFIVKLVYNVPDKLSNSLTNGYM